MGLALLLLAAVQGPPAEVRAIGIVMSPAPGRSVAVLREGDRTRIVSEGETAFGGRVVAIAPGAVWIERGGARVELRLPAEAAREKAPAPAAPAPALEASEAPAARSLPRSEVERRLAAELPRILAETALMPVTEDGEVKGLGLMRLPEGTLLSDAGLRQGDVLTEINGVRVDSLATLVALWPRLQGERELKAVVLRNGRPLSLTVALQ